MCFPHFSLSVTFNSACTWCSNICRYFEAECNIKEKCKFYVWSVPLTIKIFKKLFPNTPKPQILLLKKSLILSSFSLSVAMQRATLQIRAGCLITKAAGARRRAAWRGGGGGECGLLPPPQSGFWPGRRGAPYLCSGADLFLFSLLLCSGRKSWDCVCGR